jgi:WD40 repeat protein
MVPTLELLPPSGQSTHHAGEISAVCYSPDGQFLLSGGWDGHLRLWDAANGMVASSLQAGQKPVSACAIAPDGTQWLSGNLDGFLIRWDAATQRKLTSFLPHPRPISAIVFGSDGHTLATAAWDGRVGLWDQAQEREGRTLGGHSDIVAGCRFTPDTRSLLSWSHDCTVRLWDVARARQLRTFEGHADRVTAAALSPDGRQAVSGSRDGVLKLWDLQANEEIRSLNIGGEIKACFFLLHGGTLGTVEANGHVRLFSLPELGVEAELATAIGVECAALAPSGQQLALGGSDGRVYFVAITGFDAAPLLITATHTSRRTATSIQRLFGRSRLTHAFLCTCPACRQPFEVPDCVPNQPAPCPNCQRPLRIHAVLPQVANAR